MIHTDLTELYGKSFFDSFERSTFQSAEAIVPLVMQLLSPRSVVDVGCGRGIWLRVFQDHGVPRVHGLDGDHATADNLFIPRGSFTAVDLSKPISIGERYDLAVCLEVIEHLPDAVAARLIQELTTAASCIMFSAAIPGQGGQHHINEQWPEHWHEMFSANGFKPFDCFRPHLFGERRVCSWYRQNLVLYVSIDYLAQNEKLAERLCSAEECVVEWVHVNTYRDHLDLTLRRAMRALPFLVWRAIRDRVKAVLANV
jgi:trans-aconitate methyltransferase